MLIRPDPQSAELGKSGDRFVEAGSGDPDFKPTSMYMRNVKCLPTIID